MPKMHTPLADELSKMSDLELLEIQGSIGDPNYREMVLAEERRRKSEKAIIQAKVSNWIAVASILIATASLIVSILTAIE